MTPKANLLERPFLHYFLHFKRPCFLGLFFILITNFFEALIPITLGKSLDFFIESEKGSFFTFLAFFVLFNAGLAICRYFWRIYWGRFHQSVAYELRKLLFHKYCNFNFFDLKKNRIGNLVSIMSNDIESFRMGIGPGVLILTDAIIGFFVFVPMMVYISFELTWKCLILTPLIPPVIFYVMRRIEETYSKRQDQLGRFSSSIQELIHGMAVIKSYNEEESQNKIIGKVSQDLRRSADKFSKVDSLFHPVMDTCLCVGGFVLVYFGGQGVFKGELTIGLLFAFFQYLKKITWPIAAVSYSASLIGQAQGSFQRIRRILSFKDEKKRKKKEKLVFECLEIKDLDFCYPDEPQKRVLKKINLEFKKGEKIALTGPTGCGKTTLLNLIRGIYERPEGHFFLNRKPIESYCEESVNDLFTSLFQDSFLFQAPVSENITLGNQSQKHVELCAKRAGIYEELQEKGFDHIVGEEGVDFSGGQVQRINLARAFFKNSEVFLLDEGLSALDMKTKAKILENMKVFLEEKSALFVTHDVSNMAFAHRIYLMEKGEIQIFGTHEELLERSPLYKIICENQLIDNYLK